MLGLSVRNQLNVKIKLLQGYKILIFNDNWFKQKLIDFGLDTSLLEATEGYTFCVKKITPDSSSIFRAISFFLWGDENGHKQIRKNVCIIIKLIFYYMYDYTSNRLTNSPNIIRDNGAKIRKLLTKYNLQFYLKIWQKWYDYWKMKQSSWNELVSSKF